MTYERASRKLAESTSRRSFLGRLGSGFVALVGGPLVATALSPQRAEAFHICGHIYTTGSCPHPYSPRTRIDLYGYPVHPDHGYPVDNKGDVYRSADQKRDKICAEIVRRRFPQASDAKSGGGWSRCCSGYIRRIVDCCSTSTTRINGDASLVGYCHGGRRVFCIQYVDTETKC
jgi:hypothetical protein